MRDTFSRMRRPLVHDRGPRMRVTLKGPSILTALALLLSCTTDDAVSPSRSREVPLGPSRVVTVVGSASIGVQSDNNTQSGGLPQFWESHGGTPDHSTGITIPPNSLYRVIVTGRIILDVNGPWASVCQQTFTPPMVGSYGPVGTGRNNNELRVHLKLVASSGSTSEIVFYQGQVGTSAPDSAVSDYLYTDTGGVLWAGHAGVFGETGGCGPNHDQGFGMYAMSGSQTIRVETETTPFRLTAVPNHIHAGDSVTFTAMRTDNGSQLVDIRSRGWNNPQGQPAAGPSCGLVENPCRRPVSASGTMWIFAAMASHGWVATADVTVFSSFTLDADQTNVHPGDTVNFTPKYDGVTGPAARWKWAADSGSGTTLACSAGVTPCKVKVHESGTMWAFTASTGGDSASKHIATLARRRLQLTPGDTVLLIQDTSVTFDVSAGGATPLNVEWSSIGYFGANRTKRGRPSLFPRKLTDAPGVSASTCNEGVTECTDDVVGSYIRIVTAIVDDSLQSDSTVVLRGQVVDVDPSGGDSTCWSVGGACYHPTPDDSVGDVNLIYVAPDTVRRNLEFKLDFTDQNDSLHIFFLTGALFIKHFVIDSTAKWVDAVYAVSQPNLGSQRPSVPGEVLFWANYIPIRSQYKLSIGGNINLGPFWQVDKAEGHFVRVLR